MNHYNITVQLQFDRRYHNWPYSRDHRVWIRTLNIKSND